MLALLSTPHDYLVAFGLLLALILACLLFIGFCFWCNRNVKRKFDLDVPARIESPRVEPCDTGAARAEHRVLEIRHRLEEVEAEAWWAA